MRLQYWSNTDEDPDRVRRRMAEFLIHESVPLALFSEIGVVNSEVQAAATRIVEEAGSALPVKRRAGWYF